MRECPVEFQDRLTAKGGTNQYGEPIFKLVWCPTQFMRVGGFWERDGFVGYRDARMAGNDPCWMLIQWEPAATWGSEARWYSQHSDPGTGLQELGSYPYHGRYRLLHKMVYRDFVNGQFRQIAIEPDSLMIDCMLPLLDAWNHLSASAKQAALQLETELEEKEIEKDMDDAIEDIKLPWRGSAASFTNQGCRTSLIDKKMDEMRKGWDQLMSIQTQLRPGWNLQ